ncbi:hypothetical protein, partial [Leisingera sp.]|uniref:hypothetical protein n=1 Tax=Leisingera sp. TaxID=1879318 RepID=UPI002B27B8E4
MNLWPLPGVAAVHCPRANGGWRIAAKACFRPVFFELPNAKPPLALCAAAVLCISIVERDLDFTRFGGDLLSQGLSPSTIGAAVLNFRVR